jgi:hypothetical protein
VAQVQEIWNKFNPRERLSAIGAALIILGWIVGIFSYGIGSSTIGLLGAIAVLAILYVKYSPTMNVTWPAPASLLILGISAIVALLALLDLLTWLPRLGLAGYFGGGVIITLLLSVVGAALMIWGAWQEYQIVKPAMPNFGSTSTSAPPPAAPSAPPAAPAAPAPAAPPAYPPASAPADDTDEAPPA